jgi:hypothetical protein
MSQRQFTITLVVSDNEDDEIATPNEARDMVVETIGRASHRVQTLFEVFTTLRLDSITVA